MRMISLIAIQHLRHLKHDKTSLVWMLIVPVIYIFIFGNAFKNTSDPSKSKAYLALYNQDSGFLAGRLIEGLASENIQLDSLDTMPDDKPIRMLVIPPHFTDSLLAARQVKIDYHKKQNSHAEASQTVEMGIRKSMYRLLADLTEINLKGKKITPSGLKRLDDEASLITLKTEYAGFHKTIPDGFYQQVPSNIVQFTLLILLMFSGGSVIQERKNGVLRRIFTSPIQLWQLYGGKMAGVLAVGMIQISVLLLIGRLFFSIHYGSSQLMLYLLLLVYCLCVSAMGLCLGFFIENHEKLIGFCIILGLTLSALSGCWWPIEIAPSWMQTLARFLPPGMALSGMHQLISFGKPGLSVLPNIGGLFGLSALFSLILIRFLRKFQPDI